MPQSRDRKKSFLFLFLIILFLSSINSQLFVQKKESLYNLNSIEVTGLDEQINIEIEKNLNFLKNTNIFFIDKEILKDHIDKMLTFQGFFKYHLYKVSSNDSNSIKLSIHYYVDSLKDDSSQVNVRQRFSITGMFGNVWRG